MESTVTTTTKVEIDQNHQQQQLLNRPSSRTSLLPPLKVSVPEQLQTKKKVVHDNENDSRNNNNKTNNYNSCRISKPVKKIKKQSQQFFTADGEDCAGIGDIDRNVCNISSYVGVSGHRRQQHHKRLNKGCTNLMYACQHGLTKDIVMELRTKPEQIYLRDSTNKSVLHYCSGQSDLVAAASVAVAAPELLESADEDGFTPLHLAVIQGNMALVNLLLANKSDVNALDNEGHSVVHWATVCGDVEALRAVLAAGADISIPDNNGGSPLHYAAQMCGAVYDRKAGKISTNLALEILNIILLHPKSDVTVVDKDLRQPLLWAASAGSARAVLALVKAGARVESSDKDGLTAIHCAASRGHTDCIDALISLCGAPTDLIDSNGCTSLHYAVTLGHADATALLLDLEADPNRQDRKGRTPAHCGCAKGQFETVKMLRERGAANMWLRNAKGDLPIHEASSSGRRDLVQWLLEQKPKQVNTTSNDGRTILHIASGNDYTDMCKMLLDFGADVNSIYRTSGNVVMTPLDCALAKGHRSTAKFLQLHGGLPASKLRLSGRHPNAINDQELVKPLHFTGTHSNNIPKPPKIDLNVDSEKDTKKIVVYVKQTKDPEECSSFEKKSSKRQICQENHHYYHHHHQQNPQQRRRRTDYRRHRTSSCENLRHHRCKDDSSASDICRSKSNIEIRRRRKSRKSRDRDTSADDDSSDSSGGCVACGKSKKRYYEHKKHKYRSRRSSKPSDDVADDMSTDNDKNSSCKKRSKKEKRRKREETSTEDNTNGRENGKKESANKKTEDLKTQSKTADEKQVGDTTKQANETTAVDENVNKTEASVITKSEPKQEPPNVPPEIVLKSPTPRTADELTDVDNSKIDNGSRTVIVTQADVHSSNVPEDVSASADNLPTMTPTIDDSKLDEKDADGELTDATFIVETKTVTKASEEIKQTQDTKNEEKPIDKVDTPNCTTPINVPSTQPEETNETIPEPDIEQTLINVVELTLPKSEATESNVPIQEETDKMESLDGNKLSEEIIPENTINLEAQVIDPNSEVEQPRKSSFTVLASDDSVDQDGNIVPASSVPVLQSQIPVSATIPTERPKSFKVLSHRDGNDNGEKYTSDEADDDTQHTPDNKNKPNAGDSGDNNEADEDNNDDNDDDDEDNDDDEDGDVVCDRRVSSGSGVDSMGRRKRLKKRIRPPYKQHSVDFGNNEIRVAQHLQQHSSRDQDSGFEPSPRTLRTKIPSPRNIAVSAVPRRSNEIFTDGRACSSNLEKRKPGDKNAVNMTTVTQSIQRNIRRYYMERKIFQHLLELKSLQIRSSKVNESVLVKRAVDDYHRSTVAANGLDISNSSIVKRYPYKEYSFKNFEIFLYETLKGLQKNGSHNFQNISDVYKEAERRLSPEYNQFKKALQCTTKTHRCLHAAHAYTGVPCAAYIPMMNHHTMPKYGFGPLKSAGVGSFYLPKILTNNSNSAGPGGNRVSLELSHGNSKQVIALPSDKLDSNKRYYVTFTVKGNVDAQKDQQQLSKLNEISSNPTI